MQNLKKTLADRKMCLKSLLSNVERSLEIIDIFELIDKNHCIDLIIEQEVACQEILSNLSKASNYIEIASNLTHAADFTKDIVCESVRCFIPVDDEVPTLDNFRSFQINNYKERLADLKGIDNDDARAARMFLKTELINLQK